MGGLSKQSRSLDSKPAFLTSKHVFVMSILVIYFVLFMKLVETPRVNNKGLGNHGL